MNGECWMMERRKRADDGMAKAQGAIDRRLKREGDENVIWLRKFMFCYFEGSLCLGCISPTKALLQTVLTQSRQ